MRHFLIVPALALAMAGSAAYAFAADDDGDEVVSVGGERMTADEITQKLADQGYDVRQIKPEGEGYEVYAIDKDGKRVESEVDAMTGELLNTDSDD